jgi:plastocyanin
MRKALLVVSLLALVHCAHFRPAAPPPPSNMPEQATIITIGSQSLSPSTVTVRAGSAVYWKNADRTTHRIVLDDHRFDTSDIVPGAMGCGVILNDAGTHGYHDANNPALTGTITVIQ